MSGAHAQPAQPPRRAISRRSAADAELIDRLVDVAIRGLPATYRQDTGGHAFTRRRAADPAHGTELAGSSPRYGAIAALGAQYVSEPDQRTMFGGRTAREFTGALMTATKSSTDVGDVAMVTWAAAELGHPEASTAVDALLALDDGHRPQPTVQAAWIVTALLAGRSLADVEAPLAAGRRRLLASRRRGVAVFPHATTPGRDPWVRRNVGCFADQVYPIQALARLAAADRDEEALTAAAACADRIVALQGEAGQWWWHYDARAGGVVEGYPVYSVHQHAMAPMALSELAEAGGPDHAPAIARGMRWLVERPETSSELIDDELALVWRKVARREPRAKAVRGLQGAASAVRPGLRVGIADRLFAPGPVDHECRPYELGWLLYAWLDRRNDEAATPA